MAGDEPGVPVLLRAHLDPVRRRVVEIREAAPRAKATNYPPLLAARVEGRLKQPLGDVFGLTIDDQGNIYVAASTANATGSGLYPNGPGAVVKIANGTGTARRSISIWPAPVAAWAAEIANRVAASESAYMRAENQVRPNTAPISWNRKA